jgi:GntR family L-lactate dehydrogenase operon transcriptional regulator
MRKPRSAKRAHLRLSAASISDDTLYAALKELGTNQGPIGCWRIRGALQAVDIIASEATAGRLLRGLDLQGLTQAVGSRGRVLTPKGRRYLVALERSRRYHSCHTDLLRAVRAETIEDVCELLIARRAVEGETARLAALGATKREVREIERAVHQHIEETHRRGVSIEYNRAFHGLIAQASGSRILRAVINVLMQEEYLQKIQTLIQHAVGKAVPEDHLVILRAIRDRQPDRAAKAMRAHIERVLRVVQDYSAAPRIPSRRAGEAHTRSP